MMGTGILTATAAARRLRTGVALVAVCAMLSSCASGIAYNDFDEAGGIPKKDYENLLGRRPPAPQAGAAASAEPPIPNFQSVIAAPAAPELADTRRVSVSVTEATPVRDILIELTRKANVDLEMDPRISGGIILTATDRPFIDVIDRIADLAELRYTFQRNTLKIELDDPFMEQYQIDALNVQRTASSSASSSTDANSASQVLGGGGGGGGQNKSETSVTSSSRSNFWGDISTNISEILDNIQSRRPTQIADGSAAFVPDVAAPSSPAAPAPPAAAPASGGAAAAGGGAPAGGILGAAAALTQGRQAQLDANLAMDKAAIPPVGATAAATAPAPTVRNSTFSVNAQSGIITVFATQRQHKAVASYLRSIRDSIMQQVLIEAKIIEVTLDDQHRTGIDWTALLGPNNDLVVTSNFNRSVVPPTFADPTISAAWSNGDGDLSIAAQLVKQFGTVRTLSSPRLTVINNQVAMLKVARNQVFFDLQVQEETNQVSNIRRITVDSEIKTVPVGIIISVQPAVNPVTRQINLSLRPSITRITGFVDDPGVALQVSSINRDNPNPVNVTSQIPIIETREVDSVVTLQSGQTIVMGGLMQEESRTQREGLPGAMDLPLVGQAVSQNIKENSVTELVIFIRATVANGPGTIHDEDIRLYKRFAPDPRPIVF